MGDVAGVAADTPGSLTYATTATGGALTAPSSNETPATLTVLAPPTATITTPAAHAKYTYGEKVTARYACSAPQDANGSTLSACSATDDLGNTISSGADLDTTDPGVHSLDVQAQDTDTDTADAQVTYTVLPDNRDTLKTVETERHGAVRFGLSVPGAGTVKLTETHGAVTVAAKIIRVQQADKTLRVSLSPGPAGRRLLAASARVRVILSVIYTPKGGNAHRLTKVLRLEGTPPSKGGAPA